MSAPWRLHHHFIPSHHNSYRPHVLRRGWLLFFAALILSTEGLFVSGLFVQQQVLAQRSIETEQVAAASIAQSTLPNSIGRQFARFAVDSTPYASWILGVIGLLLTLAVIFAFFVHIQIQQPELLFSGALMAMFAFSLMATNFHILDML